MKTVKMTLTNEFHGTSVTLSAKNPLRASVTNA